MKRTSAPPLRLVGEAMQEKKGLLDGASGLGVWGFGPLKS